MNISFWTYFRNGMPQREMLVSSIAAGMAILLLVAAMQFAAGGFAFKLMVLASMGASALLVFAVPHSPMAQPWPVMGGHLISALLGICCARWMDSPALAAAVAVGLSVYVMSWLDCLHPPSAATAMIAVLGGPQIRALGWQFCYEVVATNVFVLVLLALAINYLIRNRRYPMRHTHHPHHLQFEQGQHAPALTLVQEDFRWALRQIDGVIDVSEEDLIDVYEFALEHAQKRQR